MSETKHIPDKSKLPTALQCVEWEEMVVGHTELFDGDHILAAAPIRNVSDPDDQWYYVLLLLHVHCDEDGFDLTDADGDCTFVDDFADIDFFVRL